MQITTPSIFLTIAIPTWNRPKSVCERLVELNQQIVEGVEVVIYENGESEETRNAVSPFLNKSIHYVSCAINNGAARNFLRCIEERESQWLWILGDDDAVLPGSTAKLIKWLRVQENTKFISTRTFQKTEGAPLVVNSAKELFTATTFSEALFISSTVWRRSAIRETVGAFVESSYTMSPQLVSMLHIVDTNGSNGIVYFDSLINPKTDEHRWSRLEFLKRVPAVLDFIESEESRKSTVGALWPLWLWAARESIKEIDSHAKKNELKKSFGTGFSQLGPYFGVYKHPIWVVFFLLVNSPFRKLVVPWKVACKLSNRLVSKLLSS